MTLKTYLAAGALMLTAAAAQASDWKLSDLKNTNTTDLLGTVLNEVTSTTNISVADLAGTWTIQGSAVEFASDNVLSKVGGAAAEQKILGQIDPYLNKYGLTGGTITIDSQGNFTLKGSKVSTSGTIAPGTDGNFVMTFAKIGNKSLGSVPVRVQKSISELSLLWDISKLKDILSYISGYAGNLGSTFSSLLKNYNGMYAGMRMAPASGITSTVNSVGTILNGTTNSSSSSSDSTKEKITDLLKILKK